MKIKKHFFAKILALVLALSPMTVMASVPSAVSYLKSQTPDAWIAQALVASGESDVATDYLKTVDGSLATDYAKAILALASAGKNPATFGNEDYVAKLKSFYVNNQMGDESLFNDDAWSILALSSVGQVDSTESQSAKNFLLANQNIDGGWGYAVGTTSDTNDTASVIMALVEAGVGTSNSVITNALNYLKSAQNSDGGFPYDPVSPWGTDSDSNSDAWVISALYKVGQDPTTWDKEGNNPITHLNSLQDTDGGFWWVKVGASEWNNKTGTAQAVVALSGKSYPVGYYEPVLPVSANLRIEGGNNTICNTATAGINASDILTGTAEKCGYTYNFQTTEWGPYLNQINDEVAQGQAGWLYFVNNISPEVGAGDYILKEGDDVLWYYGEWGWMPTRLAVDQTNFTFGQTANIVVEYFDGQNWLGLDNATIKANNQTYTTDNTGKLTAILPAGKYFVLAEKNSYIRSNQVEIEASLATNQISTSTETVLNTAQTEAVVTPNLAITISVPVDVVNATLNLQALLNNNSAVLPNITLNTNTSLSVKPIEVIFPDGVIVTSSVSWNGIIQAPKIVASDSTVILADNDKTVNTSSTIEIGNSEVKLSFDKAVRLSIPDSDGKDVGYVMDNVFTKITNTCSADTQEVGNALAENGECRIDVGTDLIIWTKHFTKFIVYTQQDKPSNHGNGGGTMIMNSSNNSDAQNQDLKTEKAVEEKVEVKIEAEKVEVKTEVEKEVEAVKVLGAELEEQLTLSEQITADANKIIDELKIVKNDKQQTDDFDKYVKTLIKNEKNLTQEQINTITNFITYGTKTATKLGVGERVGVLNSYQSTFGKLPTTTSDWEDVLKISNGFLPAQNKDLDQVKKEFVKIYHREADLKNTQDKLAIDTMLYGLRPAVRNLETEKSALKIFQTVYGVNPNDAKTWDVLRAIAYSGVVR